MKKKSFIISTIVIMIFSLLMFSMSCTTSGTDGGISPPTPGQDGISITWLGAFSSHPDNPNVNDAYYNTTDGNVYIWDGDSWEVMVSNPDMSSLVMVEIPAGSFDMGQTGTATPVHTVNISSFYMARTEVTYRQFYDVYNWATRQGGYTFTDFVTDVRGDMGGHSGNDPGHTEDEPVTYIEWYDAVLWCNALSEMDGLTPCYYTDALATVYRSGKVDINNVNVDWDVDGYRLPTEAEWEYAYRAGTTTLYYWGDGSTLADINLYAWYDENSGVMTHRVGKRLPNDFVLYDMSGNVWEWCWDWSAAYSGDEQTDPHGPDATGSFRVLRGGSWDGGAGILRSAGRFGIAPGGDAGSLGFRPCRAVE